ncbi:MAG: hypothetical protein R3F22_02130 [Lysobacteraceae bacterium]
MPTTKAIETHGTPERIPDLCFGTLLMMASVPAFASGGNVLDFFWLQFGLFLVTALIIHLAVPRGAKLAAASGFFVTWVVCLLVTAGWPFDANRLKILLTTTLLPALGFGLGILASQMVKRARRSTSSLTAPVEPDGTED